MTGRRWWQQTKVWWTLPVIAAAHRSHGLRATGVLALRPPLLWDHSSGKIQNYQYFLSWNNLGQGCSGRWKWAVQCPLLLFKTGIYKKKKSSKGTCMPVLEGNCREQKWKSQKQGEQMTIWWTNPISRTEKCIKNCHLCRSFYHLVCCERRQSGCHI